jgi:hypothetical protein
MSNISFNDFSDIVVYFAAHVDKADFTGEIRAYTYIAWQRGEKPHVVANGIETGLMGQYAGKCIETIINRPEWPGGYEPTLNGLEEQYGEWFTYAFKHNQTVESCALDVIDDIEDELRV